jgi:hypothetical protein
MVLSPTLTWSFPPNLTWSTSPTLTWSFSPTLTWPFPYPNIFLFPTLTWFFSLPLPWSFSPTLTMVLFPYPNIVLSPSPDWTRTPTFEMLSHCANLIQNSSQLFQTTDDFFKYGFFPILLRGPRIEPLTIGWGVECSTNCAPPVLSYVIFNIRNQSYKTFCIIPLVKNW